MTSIEKSKAQRARLEAHCERASHPNIDNYLDRAVYQAFRGLVLIDEARPELHGVLSKINAEISVLELKAFVSPKGERLFQLDTLYDEAEEPEVNGQIGDPDADKERRRQIRANSDTIIVPAREGGFQDVAVGQNQWYSIRIGAAMRSRIQYIGFYRTAPVSAVTHMAEISKIEPYEDSGRFRVLFKDALREIDPVPAADGKNAPQGSTYLWLEVLQKAETLEEARDMTYRREKD